MELVEESVEQEQLENGHLEVEAQMVNVLVDVVYSGDMAWCYEVLGLSGATGCFPSPFSLVPPLPRHLQHAPQLGAARLPVPRPRAALQEMGGLQKGLQEWWQPGQERSPPLRRQGGPHHPLWRGHQGLPRHLPPPSS